jgi:pyruvate dehydrogenase complex dehydrogenase (E1) component
MTPAGACAVRVVADDGFENNYRKRVYFTTATRLSALAYEKIIASSQNDAELFSRLTSRIVTIETGVSVVAGGWRHPPEPGADLAIAYRGAVAPEALAAHRELAEDTPEAGLLAITSPDRLHRDWRAAQRERRQKSVAERLLARLKPGAALVTVGDFHPATLSWLGAVAQNPIVPLGVDRFGQSGDIPDLYRAYGIDAEAILDAAARACLLALGRVSSASALPRSR